MKSLMSFLLIGACLAASDEAPNYQKYQEPYSAEASKGMPPTDLVPTPLEELPKDNSVTLTVVDNKGLTVSIDGRVVLFIKDRITEIKVKNEKDEKCTIL